MFYFEIVIFTRFRIRTSETCGPFRYVEFMHQIFFNAIADMDGNNTVLVILSFISKPGVIALILIGMTYEINEV